MVRKVAPLLHIRGGRRCLLLSTKANITLTYRSNTADECVCGRVFCMGDGADGHSRDYCFPPNMQWEEAVE